MSKFYDENIGEVLDSIERAHTYTQGLYAEKLLFERVLLVQLLKENKLEFTFDDADIQSTQGFDLHYEITGGGKLKLKIEFPEKGTVL